MMNRQSSSSRHITVGRVLAPREHGALVCEPALDESLSLARENAQQLANSSVNVAGRSLSEFRAWTRQECLRAASEWMQEAVGISPPETDSQDRLLFVTGHQPQLAHPGVWMKNVAVASMAQASHGIGLNLIVDNDTVDSQAISLPSGTRDVPQLKSLAYDNVQARQPWEELAVQNQEAFGSFGERVKTALRDWSISPVIKEVWPCAVELAERSERTVDLLSACRIGLERRWGFENFELPVSRLCETDPFLAFVAYLSRQYQSLFDVYNQAVNDYRQRYGIRSTRHPVPNLEQRGDLLEFPFWYWKEGERDRQRLFVRSNDNGGIELWSTTELLTTLTTEESDIENLRLLQKQGKLRTRALTTTLFTRLCLSDLFIHGIGGAKYDEITDVMMSSLFGLFPPAYVTLTATLHLPIDPFEVTEQKIRDIKHQLRDFDVNPDRYLNSPEALELTKQKQELISVLEQNDVNGLTHEEYVPFLAKRRAAHLALKPVRHQLSMMLNEQRQRVRNELSLAQAQMRANTILKRREFAAVLFPESELLKMVHQIQEDLGISEPERAVASCCRCRNEKAAEVPEAL